MAKTHREYRYYDLVMAAFVTVLLCSNLIGVGKVATVGPFTFGAGALFFPISYVFGDILTEVYGYARSRKVVWAGFVAMIFAMVMSQGVIALPPVHPEYQGALEAVFGSTPRIVLASLLGYFAGEFVNSFTLAKLKIYTQGRFLWVRTIGSTIVGEMADSLIFYPIAFLGHWPTEQVFMVLFTNYAAKVLVEVAMTPLTYQIVGFLKRREHEDFYDYETNFTPFSLKT